MRRDDFLKNKLPSIKEEDIKEEIKEEEIVHDFLTIHQKIKNINVFADIQKELRGEECVDDPISIAYSTDSIGKEEMKEEEKESNEGKCIEDSNLETNQLVCYS